MAHVARATPEMILYTQQEILLNLQRDPNFKNLSADNQRAIERCLVELKVDDNDLSEPDRQMGAIWLYRHHIETTQPTADRR